MFKIKNYEKVIGNCAINFMFTDGENIHQMLESISQLSKSAGIEELHSLADELLKESSVSIDKLLDFVSRSITLISPSYRLFSRDDDDFEFIIYDKFFSFAGEYPIMESDIVDNDMGNLMCHIKQITNDLKLLRNGEEDWCRMLSKDIANRINKIFEENPIPEIIEDIVEEVEIIDSEVEDDKCKAYIVEAKSYPKLEYIKLNPNFKTDLIDLDKFDEVRTSLKNMHMFKRKGKPEFACLSANGVLCFGEYFEKTIQKGLCW